MFLNPTIMSETMAQRVADLRRQSAPAARMQRLAGPRWRRAASEAPARRARFRIRPAPVPQSSR